MNITHRFSLTLAGLGCLCCLSCRKYLSKVPDESLIIPSSVADYLNLLDNNLMTVNSTPGLGPLGVDDYYLSYSNWLGLTPPAGTAYNWQADIFQGQPSLSWDNPYDAIYYSNVVLDGMGGLGGLTNDSSSQAEYNAVWGSALFYRAFHLYNLEETFGQPYRPSTAAMDAGIPLRLSDDPTQTESRASVQAVYQRIVQDLEQALPLLPAQVQWSYRNRPCEPAAYALLARAYLTMQDYQQAEASADSCLGEYNGLVDYNTVDSTKPHPFPVSGNNEVLFQCSAYNYAVLYDFEAEIDTNLYRSYDPNDLRRVIFFRPAPSGDGGVCFKGNYTGQIYLFSGLATDEVFLVRAECRARLGDATGAMTDLNTLLAMRWRTGTFIPYTAATPGAALDLVLAERRKETVYRELRWADLRRLNQDPRSAVELVRVLGRETDTLPAMDNRYAYPIPDDEILLSGIPQNTR
jgi:tetratricopeptide (TPR) repeat protein